MGTFGFLVVVGEMWAPRPARHEVIFGNSLVIASLMLPCSLFGTSRIHMITPQYLFDVVCYLSLISRCRKTPQLTSNTIPIMRLGSSIEIESCIFRVGSESDAFPKRVQAKCQITDL